MTVESGQTLDQGGRRGAGGTLAARQLYLPRSSWETEMFESEQLRGR